MNCVGAVIIIIPFHWVHVCVIDLVSVSQAAPVMSNAVHSVSQPFCMSYVVIATSRHAMYITATLYSHLPELVFSVISPEIC